jgi:FkbM family methyltransferase
MSSKIQRIAKRLRWVADSELFRREPLTLAYRIASWEVIRLIGRPIIEKIGHNLIIASYPSEGYSRALHYFHFNKPFIARFYDQVLRDGMVYIDCGANIGIYSLVAARKVGEHGAVYSFEPQPDIFHRLLVNIHLNRFDNIYAHNLAVGDRVGKVELVQLRDHVGSFVRPLHQLAEAAAVCDITTLDAFFTDHPISRADVLKIDVEGFELRVLQGARQLIARHKPSLIQFEYYSNYPLLPRDEWPTLDIYKALFEELGYDGFFCVNRHSGCLERLQEGNPQDNDVFCVERGVADSFRRDLFA